MATLDEVYAKALADEAEREAFAKAAPDEQALAAYLKEHGCDATPGEARAFLDGRLSCTGELAHEELAAVSGGSCIGPNATCEFCRSTDTEEIGHDWCTTYFKCHACGREFSIGKVVS